MKCKKCGLENLQIIKSGPHNKLVCGDCLAYQRFISNNDAKVFNRLKNRETL